MGYEDPEIAQARQRQGMLGGLDVSDPNALRQAAQNADPQTASMLVARAMELEKGSAEIDAQQALVNQRNREARISFGNDREAFAKELYGKSFNDLTPTEASAVNRKFAEAEVAAKKAGASTVSVSVAPTIKQGSSVTDLMNNIDNLTKADQEMLRSSQTTKQLINEATTANNSQAWEAARTQVAKAIGEGKLSNEDIRRTGVDPRFVQGALDWANKKIEGVPNQDIMKQLYTVASLLEKTSVERINNKMGKARTIGTKEGGLSQETAETLFPSVGSNTGAVEWSQPK
jgi:hypothetical protein